MRQDAFFACEQIMSHAEDLDAKFLFIPGDVFDMPGNKDDQGELINYLMGWMDSAYSMNCKPVFIMGQHDRHRPPILGAHHWALHAHKKAVELPNNLLLYGLDWLPPQELQVELQAIPTTADIFMGHQICKGLMGDTPDVHGDSRAEMSLTQIPYASLALMGDFHKHTAVKTKTAEGEDLTVLSAGSSYMRTVSEDPVKAFYKIYDDLSYESVELDWQRKYLTPPTIVTPEDLDRFVERAPGQVERAISKANLPEAIRKPVLVVTYNTALKEVKHRIDSVVRDTAFIHYRTITQESEERQQKRIEYELVRKVGPLGCLHLLVPDTESRLYKDMQHVLQAGETGNGLQAFYEIRKEFGLAPTA